MAASFPVWVGELALGMTENVLLDLFNKFGPVKDVTILRDENGRSKQYGFVNFWSCDVAEAAALGMNGCDILGRVIETRGPKQLTQHGKPYTSRRSVNQEKYDIRELTDCVDFVYKNDCPLKTDQCPYRHCVQARQAEVVCEKWKKQQCVNLLCTARHPKNDTLKYQPAQPPRCPSHNAFKCTGECGSEDCDTHFMEMEAMQEHINKGREKKYLPSGACAICKAVFFSDEERKRHACFKQDTQESAKIPVYHPPAGQSILTPRFYPYFSNTKPSMATSDCGTNVTNVCKSVSSSRRSTDIPKTVVTCIACGSNYENSGDSLSSFDFGLEGVGFGGHKCPNSPSIRNIDNKEEPEPIGVFWDIENCPVPRGKSALDVVRKIRDVFFTSKREVEFMCVCDISKEKKEVIEDLNKAQVTVVHINATSKNAADDKLRQSLRRFAQSYPPPATVILVSGDINFAAELSDLRHRHNVRVVCLHNAQAQTALLACAHETRRYDLFTSDLPVVNTPPRPVEENGLSSELTVLNLPVGKDVTQIKARLKKLSDNCGGKVVSVTGRTAVVRFPNHLSAARAKKRMDGEDVFGSVIKVIYSSHSNSASPLRGSPMKGKRVQLPEKQDNSLDTIISGPCRLSKFVPIVIKEQSVKPTTHTAKSSPLKSTRRGEQVMKNPDRNHYLRNDGTQNDINGFDDDNIEEFTGKPTRLVSQPLTSTATQSYLNPGPYLNNNSYPTIWQHPYYQSLINLSGHGGAFAGMNPLTMPVMGAPHLTASWLASLHNFTVLDQQRGGIDLLVSNLDENVSKKELKKKLASVFREHCKVYSVVLHAGEGMPLRAFIKVPKLSDAQIALSKVNNQQIFNSHVTVTIATEKEKELCFLRCEVTSVLKEAPLHWMPLTKFLSDFYEKCSHAFDMNAVSLFPDLVIVIGKPGSQAIGLVTHTLGTLKVVIEQYSFGKDVHCLLKQHKGNLPLVNFAASFWIKFGKEIEVGEKGIPFSAALEAIPNVCVISDSGRDVVTWAKTGICNGGVINKLLELSTELQELLKAQPEFKLPLSQLIAAYQKWFNRKLPFDPMHYGFSSVRDLLDALPSVVQVVDDGIERYITLTPKLRVKVFEEEVKILLESQPAHAIPLGNFMSAYHKCFGHKCKIADYGYFRMVDLMEAVQHVAKMRGTGDNRMIYLVDSVPSQPRKAEFRMTLHILSRELRDLLATCEGQRLPVSKVMVRYYEHYGQHFKIGECGFALLEDLLASVPGVQMIEVNGEKFVSLPVPAKTALRKCSITKEIIELINQQDGKFLPISHLSPMYRKQFNRKFPLTARKLEELVESTGKELQIKGKGVDQILFLSATPDLDKRKQHLEPLSDDIRDILMKFPGCRVARTAFPDIYARNKGRGIKPKRWGYLNLDALLEGLSDVVEIVGSGDLAAVCLRQDYLLRSFAREVVQLLHGHTSKTITVAGLPKLYEKSAGCALRPQHYGFSQLSELLDAVSSVVKVLGDDNKARLRLSPLQTFAIETKQLLVHHEGCISLNRFAPCFQQLYNRPCRAADHGYSRIAEVLGAVAHVAEIRGKGADKIVVLSDKADVLLDHIGGDVEEDDVDSPHASSEYIDNDSSDSNADSVVVEEEIDESEDPKIDDIKEKTDDLILLDGDHGKPKCGEGSSGDWMMAPVTQSLPEPDLYPSVPLEPLIVGDLIYFTEFDTELFSAGLDASGLLSSFSNFTTDSSLNELSRDNELVTEDDIYQGLAEVTKNLELRHLESSLFPHRKGEISWSRQESNVEMIGPSKCSSQDSCRPVTKARNDTECHFIPIKSKIDSVKPQVLGNLPDMRDRQEGLVLSPGFRQLSEVEAEILNSSGNSSPMDAPPVRRKPGVTNLEGKHEGPTCLDTTHKGKKSFGSKVKLAVKFTMGGKK